MAAGLILQVDPPLPLAGGEYSPQSVVSNNRPNSWTRIPARGRGIMHRRILWAMLASVFAGAAQGATADTPVAAMEQVEHSVYGTPPQGTEGMKHQGDGVVFEESLQTLQQGGALVRFIDGSGLAMGAQTRVLVDTFVFDPDAAKGNAILNMTVGTLRFATGAMPIGGVVIRTPSATLTLRGTDVTVHVHFCWFFDVVVL